MKNDAHKLLASDQDGVALAGNAWTRFWFTPTSVTGLHCLRVLSGLLFICWLLSFVGYQEAFFSTTGWFDREAYLQLQQGDPGMAPPIGWSMLYLAGDSSEIFQALYWGSLVILALFTLGVATRITGILTWVIVVSFLANPATSYEGDYMLGILAFYLMIGYALLGLWNSPLTKWEMGLGSRYDFVFAPWVFAKTPEARPVSYAANLAMRLMQLHLMIIIVTSGVHKLQMPDWWAGIALWYPLHPPFQTTVEGLKRELPSLPTNLFFLSLIQYAVLAWQIGFPLFAWRQGKWRVVLLGGATIGWLGSFFLLKLPLFGPFVFLGCLSFLGPDEWAWMTTRVKSWLGSAVSKQGPAKQTALKAPVMAGKENIKR